MNQAMRISSLSSRPASNPEACLPHGFRHCWRQCPAEPEVGAPISGRISGRHPLCASHQALRPGRGASRRPPIDLLPCFWFATDMPRSRPRSGRCHAACSRHKRGRFALGTPGLKFRLLAPRRTLSRCARRGRAPRLKPIGPARPHHPTPHGTTRTRTRLTIVIDDAGRASSSKPTS